MNRTAQLVAGIVLLVLLLGLWPGLIAGPGIGYIPVSLVGLLLIVIIVMLVLGGRGDVP
jgi:hypothetical protein